MAKILLKIITPEKKVFEELVDSVTLPTQDGEITVLPGHIPLISALTSGDIVARADSHEIPFAVVGGFIEVDRNSLDEARDIETTVSILADFAEHVGDISDTVIAEAEKRAAEIRAMKEHATDVDFEHFEAELERSLTRVKIADKWRKKKYK